MKFFSIFVQNHTGSVNSLFQKFTGTYRYGFNGKEKDDDVAGAGNTYDYGFRIYNAQLGKFLSVDPLTKKFSMLSTYQFASNCPITGIDLDGLEYLDANVARVKVVGGEAHINLANFNTVTRSAWEERNLSTSNWSYNCIGSSTKIGELVLPQTSASPEPANLDNSYSGDVNPAYNPTQHNIQNPTAASTGFPDQRYKQQTPISGASGMTPAVAGVMIAVNAINWGLNLYGSIALLEDKKLVSEHRSILQKQVMRDVNVAIKKGMIGKEYLNKESLGNIANVVLTGQNLTTDPKIYDIGIKIVKEISKNYQGAPVKGTTVTFESHNPNAPSDNTTVKQNLQLPEQTTIPASN